MCPRHCPVRIFCPIVAMSGFFQQILIDVANLKFYTNCSRSVVDICAQTSRTRPITQHNNVRRLFTVKPIGVCVLLLICGFWAVVGHIINPVAWWLVYRVRMVGVSIDCKRFLELECYRSLFRDLNQREKGSSSVRIKVTISLGMHVRCLALRV
jgi:hypothetical protein